MIKVLILFFTFNSFLFSASFKNFSVKNIFSFSVPEKWEINEKKEYYKETGIYKVVISTENNVSVTVKYYSPKSNKKYMDYVKKQSTSSTGDENIEKYDKLKVIKIKGRRSYLINREFKEYSSIDYTSSNSYWVKETLIVIPSYKLKKGFYSIEYSAPSEYYKKYYEIFRKIVNSLKPAH